jgi:uncharacterized membrane protein
MLSPTGGILTTEMKKEEIMGPVDFLVIMFPGNKFNGKIAPELSRLERSGIIKVIDLLMVMKDSAGEVKTIELRNLGGEVGEAFKTFSHNIKEWLSLDDIEEIGSMLPNNSSAAALLIENTWALRFKEELLNSDAQLVTQGRIPDEMVMAAMKERITPGGA